MKYFIQQIQERFVLNQGGASPRTTLNGASLGVRTHGHKRDIHSNENSVASHSEHPNRHPERSEGSSPSEESVNLIRGRDKLTTPLWHALNIAFVVLAIILCIGLGSTLAYFTAEDEKTHIVPLESIQLSLTEEWQEETGIGYFAGLTAVKSPTIQADSGVMYARICMRVEESVPDGSGGTTTQLITNPERLRLIQGILYADTHDLLQPGSAYSLEDIQSTQGVSPLYNPAHFLAPSEPELGLYYFEYDGVMDRGTSATLFNKVVIPTDYSASDLALMGNFIITLEGQGIQSFGFSSQTDAMEELNKVVS